MVNVYTYLDYRKFLTDFYKEMKETTSHFSFRYFARVSGFKSTNYLKFVMDGKRNLSQEGIRKFCKGLKLKKEESEFFENMVHMNQSKTLEERNFYYKRMTGSKKYIEAKSLEKDQYDYYSNWYNVAIRELIALPKFREDPNWIVKKLSKKITRKEALQAIELLLRLKIVERDEKGKLKQVDKAITTGAEVKSLAVANFHKNMLQKAASSIDETPAEFRDISSLTIPVSRKTLEEAKKKIIKFRKELHAYLSEQEDYDAIYQFNFQLFNLSEVPWKRKK